MADDPSVLAGTASARLALEESEEALLDLIDAFRSFAVRVRDPDDDVTPAEISKARTALAQVRSQLVEEVSKHEKRVLQSEGLVADAPLDFDALRSSIGRKLDSIRRAEDSE